jgi:hypothetical protein
MRFYDVLVNRSVPTEANRGLTSYSERAGCLYRQTADSWNVLDTLGDVIICNHLSASRRFRHVPEPSMRFHKVSWDSVRFHEIP